MRHILFALSALALVGTAAPSLAAPPCRDAKGHFAKCAPVKPIRCRDAKGRFAKCGAPGAHPDK